MLIVPLPALSIAISPSVMSESYIRNFTESRKKYYTTPENLGIFRGSPVVPLTRLRTSGTLPPKAPMGRGHAGLKSPGSSSLYIWIRSKKAVHSGPLRGAEGRGYGEAGGEGFFFVQSSNPSPTALRSPLSRKRARAIVN